VTFLNPWYLAALSGALVPIILHLIARRNLRSRPFSSLVFLAAIERSAIRWARVNQHRLLVLRVSLLVVTVVALARPSCTPGQPGITVIALDGSASMGAERGVVWRRAQDAALMLLESAPGRVEVGLATATLQVRNVSSEQERTDLVRQLVPRGVALDMGRVLADAVYYARQSGEQIRLLLVSDFQPGGWDGLREVPPQVELWGTAVRGVQGNLSLGQLSLAGAIRGEGVVEVGGVIERHGVTGDSCLVTVVTAQGEHAFPVSLTADETPFSLSIPRPRTPLISATVVVDDPQGSVFDDRREAARWAADSCRVLVLGPDTEVRRRLLAALDPDGDGRWGFEVRVAPCEDLTEDSLDVLVMLGASRPGECVDGCLERWSAGAGLVLIADDEPLSDTGAALYRRTFGVAPGTIHKVAEAPTVLRYDHPVLAPFRHLPPNGFAPPQVSRLWSWRGGGFPMIGVGDDALLVESTVQSSGRVLSFMTGLTPPWSDWASRTSFVPLLQLAVDHAAGSLGAHPVPFGTSFSWDVPWPGEGRATLESPDRSQQPVVPDHVHAGIARVQLGPFVEPGLYVLRREERPVALFEPVVPAAECLVAPPIQPRSVARWVDPSDPPWPTSATREPASLLLAGALGLLLGEAWLALRITRGAPLSTPPGGSEASPPRTEVPREQCR